MTTIWSKLFKVNMTSTATIVANSPGNFIIEANALFHPIIYSNSTSHHFSVFLTWNQMFQKTRVVLSWGTPLATWQLFGRRPNSSPSLSPIKLCICFEIWNVFFYDFWKYLSHILCVLGMKSNVPKKGWCCAEKLHWRPGNCLGGDKAALLLCNQLSSVCICEIYF